MRKKGRPTEETSMARIIQDADAEQLRAFLLAETQRNTSLDLKLRAHLARDQDSDAYQQVLARIVKHNIHGTIKLTRRSIHLLRDIAQRFVDDQREFLRNRELRKAWEAGQAVISHLHLLMDKYHGPEPKLVAILSEAYQNVYATFLARPAPELQVTMTEGLLELLQRPHHVIYDIQANAAVVCR